MKLSDSTIAHLIKLLQMAILTGTDVSDNFRLLELTELDGKLEIDENYLEVFNQNLDKIVQQANENIQTDNTSEVKVLNG